MKLLIFICFGLIISSSTTHAQDNELLGSWEIIQFSIENEDNTNIKNEKELKEEGSIWELVFADEGKLNQTSNMRTGATESWEGTWEISDENMKLNLNVENRIIALIYTFILNEDLLTLIRENPAGTMKIITKFKKR